MRALPAVPMEPDRARELIRVALPALAFAALAVMVRRYDAPLALGATLLLTAGVLLLIWPEAATLLAVFLLYTNAPAIATRYHGVPEPVAAAFILLLALPVLHHLLVRGERLRTDEVVPMLLLFLGVLLVASLRARSVEAALEHIAKFVAEGFLLYLLVINAVRSAASLRRVIWTALAAGSLLGTLSLYQEATGSFDQQFGGLAHRNYEYLALREQLRAAPDDPAVREALRSHSTGERSRRAEGPMDEPNRYAQILIVLLPLAAFLHRSAGSRAGRLCAAAAGAAVLGGIVVSYSRGAFLAVGLLLAAGLFLRWVRPAHLLIGSLALVPVIPAATPALVERVGSIGSALSLVRDDAAEEADGAIRGRATAMMAAFQVFLDHPVIGVGPGQYTDFYSAEYHQKNPRLKFRDLREPRRAHSLYLEMAAELGVVGLSVFLSTLLLLLRELWRARRRLLRRSPEHAELATAFCLSLLAYLATAAFLHLAYQRYFWFLVALAGTALLVIRAWERSASEHACHPQRPGEDTTCSPWL